MNGRWLGGYLFVILFAGTASAQDFVFSGKGNLKRGGETTILLVATTTSPITITDIKAGDKQGFNVDVQKCPCHVDGTQTYPVRISRPFWTGIGGPNAGEKSISFIIDYTTADGKTNSKAIVGSFTYGTAAVVYYFYGFVGILIGFTVKLLLTKQTEKDSEGKPLQMGFVQYLLTNRSKLIVVLCLGLAVLLYSDIQTTALYGWREAIILGLVTGIVGDEGLVQKISALKA